MSEFELIDKGDVPAPQTGHIPAFADALDAAIRNPESAVKLAGLDQRQRNRLQQITSATESNKSGRYAGKVKVTTVRNDDKTYDVYLTAVPAPAPVSHLVGLSQS